MSSLLHVINELFFEKYLYCLFFTFFQAADSVLTFNFNKKRVRLLSDLNDIKEGCKGILYWMFRDVRVQGIVLVYMVD